MPKEAQQKVKQKLPKRTIDKLPSTFPYIFKHFCEGHRPPERSSWNRDLEKLSKKAAPDLSEFSRLQARAEELQDYNETFKRELEKAERDKKVSKLPI